MRRPSRIGCGAALPAGAAQRHEAGLGRDGADGRREPVQRGRGRDRASRRSPPAPATSARRAATSSGVSSPSQPAPKTAPSTVRPASRRCGAAASSTASASGLASPGSSPWARTSPPTSSRTTASAVEVPGGVDEPVGDARGPAVRVDEQRRRAQQLGHAGLGEAEAAGPRRPGTREGDGGVQDLGVADLVEAPRAGQGVDRAPLPGQAAQRPRASRAPRRRRRRRPPRRRRRRRRCPRRAPGGRRAGAARRR